MAQKKKNTHPGLGDSTPRPPQPLPRFDSASIERVKVSQRETVRESRESEENTASSESSEPSGTARSKRTTTRSFESDPPPEKRPSWEPESPTGTRRKKQSRPPVTVDDVGRTAVRIAGARRESAPKLLASRAMLSRAPIDSRAAFVLSMIDGQNSVDALVDATGMEKQEVSTILERCARLGLIELP